MSTTSESDEQQTLQRLRLFLWLFLALVLVLLGWSTVYRVAWDDVTHTDYTVYRAAGQAVLDGGNIYTVQNEHGWNYVYPPPFALLMVPLAKLSLAVGSGLWFLLETAALALSSIMSVSLLGSVVSERHKTALYALPLLFLSTLLASGIMRCQASGFVIALVIATFYFHLRGRTLLAGLSLAAAIVIKVFPLTLLAYFVVRRQWRALLATLAGISLMLLLLPSLFWGWQQNNKYLDDWMEAVAKPALMSNAERASSTPLYAQLMNAYKSRNQSLQALFLSARVNPDLAAHLSMAVGSIMLLPMLLAARRIKNQQDELLLCSAFILWQLLIPPISETHYFGMMILPLTVLLGRMFYTDAGESREWLSLRALSVMMIAAMIMIGWTASELFRPLCLACLLIWADLLRRLYLRPAGTGGPLSGA